MSNDYLISRRTILTTAAVGLGAAPADPHAMSPQVGDRLVYAEGDRTGTPIEPRDLSLGGPQTLAWPATPDIAVVRDGARANQILLLRLDPTSLDSVTFAHAVDGVVAYGAMCSHAGCVVKAWQENQAVLKCPCHNSRYDPRHNAAVVFGPAPRGLAALPLASTDGLLVVAEPFVGKVGPSSV